MLRNVQAVFWFGDLEVSLCGEQCVVVAAEVDHRPVRWSASGKVSDLERLETERFLRIEHSFLVGTGLLHEGSGAFQRPCESNTSNSNARK